MLRNSTENAVGNTVFEDLEMTSYPKYKDSRTESEVNGKLNPNLRRFENLKDYNMAEHINALQDTVLAIQRTLGTMVQVPYAPKDDAGNVITNEEDLINIAKNYTVKERIDELERFDWVTKFDKRYGGPTWKYDEASNVNPTIQQHRHLGTDSDITGMPQKISLEEEVQGLLPKDNVNLSRGENGITGADICVDMSSSKKISESINDKISEAEGGYIAKRAKLEVLGKINTRWAREFDAEDAIGQGNSKVSDKKTLTGVAMESHDTKSTVLLNQSLEGMYHGSYVAIVRLSVSGRLSSEVVEIVALDLDNNIVNRVQLKGTDFPENRGYKDFYMVFENDGNTKISIRKLNTSVGVRVRFDHAIITPVHPAVFGY